MSKLFSAKQIRPLIPVVYRWSDNNIRQVPELKLDFALHTSNVVYNNRTLFFTRSRLLAPLLLSGRLSRLVEKRLEGINCQN